MLCTQDLRVHHLYHVQEMLMVTFIKETPFTNQSRLRLKSHIGNPIGYTDNVRRYMLIGQAAAIVTQTFNENKIKLHMFIYGGLSEGILRFSDVQTPAAVDGYSGIIHGSKKELETDHRLAYLATQSFTLVRKPSWSLRKCSAASIFRGSSKFSRSEKREARPQRTSRNRLEQFDRASQCLFFNCMKHFSCYKYFFFKTHTGCTSILATP